MPKFYLTGTVAAIRSYEIEAVNEELAEEIVREGFERLPYDIISEELDDVAVDG